MILTRIDRRAELIRQWRGERVATVPALEEKARVRRERRGMGRAVKRKQSAMLTSGDTK
jgi:hypothetical protein